jgi:GcrA cell cycle regulator
MNTRWTDQEKETLRQMWNADEPIAAIICALDRNNNQIVGQAYRMNLPRRNAIKGKGHLPRKADVPRKKAWKPPHYVAPLVVRSCQWPHGDPTSPDFHFCGEEVVEGKPYCDKHCAVAYTKYETAADAQRAVEEE